MTKEEKAKAYDIALDKIKMLLGTGNSCSREKLEYVFPELAESEGERIRKWIRKEIESKYVIDNIVNNVMADKALAWLEKQGEQKPVDKVEPKFKVGDWVVSPNGVYWHIDSINNNRYEVASTDGARADWPLNTSLYRLWTIQDAKDGDVLVSNHSIFIFSQEYMVGKPEAYCGLMNGLFIEGNDACWTNKKCYPTTKEQRDLLFKKMKEAGYEWDAEKKELKKIEQKSTEWEPQTGDTFRKKGTTSPTYHLCDKREDGITFGFVENREVGIAGGEITIFALRQDYELVEKPKSIEDVVEEELNKGLQTKVEQKPAWSEEDENHVKSILSTIECCKAQFQNAQSVVEAYNADINWLKSLKDRYTWKPSEGQMVALNCAITAASDDLVCLNVKDLESLYEQLKKLREE